MLAKTIPAQIILESVLLSEEEAFPLKRRLESQESLTAEQILALDIPSKNRVDALLRYEFIREKDLRVLSCDFARHTLHIFESRVPYDRSLRQCLLTARDYARGIIDREELQDAIRRVIPVVWKLEGTPFIGSFESGMAVTFLDYRNASELARIVAVHTQRAAHRYFWENRKSNVQPMTAREKEASWQLKRIATVLCRCV